MQILQKEIKLPSINEVKAERCRRSFEYYIKYIQKEYYGYDPNLYDYQLEIVDELEKVLKGETSRLIINLPPRYRKTEIAVKMWISYCIAMNPKARFIHLSYSDDLALDNSECIKDIIQSDCYQRLFPVKLKKDSKSKKKWYTEEGGGVYATSSGGQVTGFGAGKSIEDYGVSEDEEIEDWGLFLKDNFTPDKFGGAIVLDDANKPEDAFSPLTLSRINNRFDSTIKNRVNSRYTPIINIQQRISKRDLSGHLLNTSNDWKLLRLQALKEDLTPLCDKIHTRDELLKLKKENEGIFNTQYQQDPKPLEGMMYEKLNFVPSLPENRSNAIRYSFTDVADTGKDYFCTWFLEVNLGKVYVYDAVYTQESSAFTSQKIKSKIGLHYSISNWIETNNQGSVFITHLQSLGVPVQGYYSEGNKAARISAWAFLSSFVNFVEPNSQPYHTSEYYNAVDHLQNYPKEGKHEDEKDDAEDAFTEALKFLYHNARHCFEGNK